MTGAFSITKMTGKVIKAIGVGILAGYIISGIVTGRASVLGYRAFFVMSESMEPTIRTHQFVVGRVADVGDIDIGDIVAYRRDDRILRKMVIHRVVGFGESGGVILQGDNNTSSDPPIEAGRVMYEIILY